MFNLFKCCCSFLPISGKKREGKISAFLFVILVGFLLLAECCFLFIYFFVIVIILANLGRKFQFLANSFPLSVFCFQRKINLSLYFGIIFFNFFPLTLALSLPGEREYLSVKRSSSHPVCWSSGQNKVARFKVQDKRQFSVFGFQTKISYKLQVSSYNLNTRKK